MQYFEISTIRAAIEHLQEFSANWLLPAFAFAANDVGLDQFTDMSKNHGTDRFLDRYFNGSRLNIPPFETGNNLLRPRLKGIAWNRGDAAGDHMIRQNTKMWGNLFSSRGYREMRQRGEIEGEKAIVRLTKSFQTRFEEEVPENFRFEQFLVWLFAFEGVPDDVNGWQVLMEHLLQEHLKLTEFGEPYRSRFRLTEPSHDWPKLSGVRADDDTYIKELAPKLWKSLQAGDLHDDNTEKHVDLSDDDPIYARVLAAINRQESFSFLLMGPPGTGKTRTARLLANKLADKDEDRLLFLQFHPAMGYDDFIEGFRPEVGGEGSGVVYRLDTRLFLKFAQKALKEPSKTFVAVVDELNRGDVARVFGEVLTYLEPDYRGMEFTLPISGLPTQLPRNLVLIATANPHDRSITDLDDALLRRFWIIELNPDRTFLQFHLKQNDVEESVVRRTMQMFELMNVHLSHGYGHTNFLRVRSIDDLADVWRGRVRMVLRRAFAYDRASFEEVATDIEDLLQISDDEASE